MSYPILYASTETDFDHNGYGILSDCDSCEVVEEGNGIFELSMKYPIDGIHFEDINDRCIIKAKADQFRDPQLFRIYSISKPMSSAITVSAEHISYDLSGIPVSPFVAQNAFMALSGLKKNAVVDCPFDFVTDKTTSAKFAVSTPSSIRSKLGGGEGSILDVYGGEYEFDNYTVKLHNNRGMNRGVSIRYGKNLTDINQEQNCASVATGIYPYWAGQVDGEDVLVELPEKIVNAPGTYNFVKIRTIDFTQLFENQPTVDQLREKAQEYVQDNKIGIPVVSMKISFTQLAQSEEYKHLRLLERVSLFDTVNVEFPALKVSATAKAVKVVYDVLADRVTSVTLGSVRANIADTISAQQHEIDKKPSKTFMEIAIESLTKSILGAKGGSVRLLDTNGDGEPDTLYIADNPDPTQAVKVWRFNYEGWGASQNGYVGPFIMGATFDTGIVSDVITAGTLIGWLFRAGMIESLDGKINIDLSGGQEPVFNTGIATNGLSIKDEQTKNTLFEIDSYNSSEGVHYANMGMFSGDGQKLLRATETFKASDPKTSIGAQFDVYGKNGNSSVSVSANDTTSNVELHCGTGVFPIMQANPDSCVFGFSDANGNAVGGMSFNKSNGKTYVASNRVRCDQIICDGKSGEKFFVSSDDSIFAVYIDNKDGETVGSLVYDKNSGKTKLIVDEIVASDMKMSSIWGNKVGWITLNGDDFLGKVT